MSSKSRYRGQPNRKLNRRIGVMSGSSIKELTESLYETMQAAVDREGLPGWVVLHTLRDGGLDATLMWEPPIYQSARYTEAERQQFAEFAVDHVCKVRGCVSHKVLSRLCPSVAV